MTDKTRDEASQRAHDLVQDTTDHIIDLFQYMENYYRHEHPDKIAALAKRIRREGSRVLAQAVFGPEGFEHFDFFELPPGGGEPVSIFNLIAGDRDAPPAVVH